MLNKVFIALFIVFLTFIPSPSVQSESPRNAHVQAKEDGITILEDRSYIDALLSKINNAKKDILITMYVFKTTGGRTNSANIIKDALIKAAQRGIAIKVLLEREDGPESTLNSENEYTARRLAKGGVMVYFDSPRERTHVKAIVIDRRYTFIGSHNLTSSALQHNRELSLMIDSEDVAKETARYIEEMISKASKKS